MAASPECSTEMTPQPGPPGSEARSERYWSRAAEARDEEPLPPLSSRARRPPKKEREDGGRIAIGGQWGTHCQGFDLFAPFSFFRIFKLNRVLGI